MRITLIFLYRPQLQLSVAICCNNKPRIWLWLFYLCNFLVNSLCIDFMIKESHTQESEERYIFFRRKYLKILMYIRCSWKGGSGGMFQSAGCQYYYQRWVWYCQIKVEADGGNWVENSPFLVSNYAVLVYSGKPCGGNSTWYFYISIFWVDILLFGP